MAGSLTIVSWAGDTTLVNGSDFTAVFTAASEAGSSPAASPIEADIPGNYPAHVRLQPNSIQIELLVTIVTSTETRIATLKQMFRPDLDPAYLVATDENNAVRRILCVPLHVFRKNKGDKMWTVVLRAAGGVWEADTETYATNTIAATGTAIALTNAGNIAIAPRIALTPTSDMSTAGLTFRRRIAIGWRSELPASDPVGDGYPTDLGQDAFDTATLTTVKMQADGDDLRTYLDGNEIYRWLDGMDTSTTKVWVNMRFAPMRKITLTAAMASSSVPAAGTTFTVNNPEGTAGLPQDFFMIIGTEALHLMVVDSVTLIVVQRGALGTTAAAHSASDPGYYVEHPYLYIFYGWPSATAPNAPTDRQPLIDFATSTNLVWHWTGNFLVPSGTRRSGGWGLERTDEGGAENLRVYETGGAVEFEDTPAAAGKPNFNNVTRDFPVPISAAANAVEMDYTVNNNLLLHGYVTDLEGNETRLITRGATAVLTNQQFTPGSVAQKLRLNGRIGVLAGSRTGTTAAALNTTGTDNGIRFTLDADDWLYGVVLSLLQSGGGSANLNVTIYPEVSSAPGSDGATVGTIANASIPTSQGDVLLVAAAPIWLAAGTYYIGLAKSNATGVVNQYYDATTAINTRFQLRLSAANHSFPPRARILTDRSNPTVDAATAVQSGDDLTIDNIDITLDNTTPRTPLIVMGAEESMYLFDNRIRNVRNWITNSGFESNTTGHAATGTSTIARSVVRSHSGIASLLCTYQNSTTLDEYAITLPVVSQSYTYTAWVWIPANWDGGQIQLTIASFTSSATVSSAFADMTKTGQWQRIKLTFSVASDVAGLLRVIAATAPTAGRFIYVDDMQVEPGVNVDAGGFFDTDGDVGGDYIDVYFPSAMNKALLIDCAQRLVWDTELNQPVPFAVTPSNPEKMLSLAPGFNSLYYTEIGVTGLTLETSHRSAWL